MVYNVLNADGVRQNVAGPFWMHFGTSGYVQFLVIAEILGLTPSWDQATYTATFENDSMTISVTRDSNIATVNGVPRAMVDASGNPAPALMLNTPTGFRTFIPVRFLVNEVLGEDSITFLGNNFGIAIAP
jgi:hypothetical protein